MVNINKPGGTLTITGALRTTHNWTWTAGSLAASASTVMFSGGTITGTGRYLKQISGGAVQVVGADPVGSIYTAGPNDEIHGYHVEGVGEDFWPSAYDTSIPDSLERVSDAESFAMTRRLAREEGMLVGGSAGMAVVAGLRVARTLPADAVTALQAINQGVPLMSLNAGSPLVQALHELIQKTWQLHAPKRKSWLERWF